MVEYRFSVIRFVPDMLRMEPLNIGIVLQSANRTDFKLNPDASSQLGIDASIYLEWQAFLTEEIRGIPRAKFQPCRTTPEFLRYLAELCSGPILLSESLVHQSQVDSSFGQVMDALYQRLVARSLA